MNQQAYNGLANIVVLMYVLMLLVLCIPFSYSNWGKSKIGLEFKHPQEDVCCLILQLHLTFKFCMSHKFLALLFNILHNAQHKLSFLIVVFELWFPFKLYIKIKLEHFCCHPFYIPKITMQPLVTKSSCVQRTKYLKHQMRTTYDASSNT